jgi:hypothetical protein
MIVMLKHRAYWWIYVDNVENVDAANSVATGSTVDSSRYIFSYCTTAPSRPGPAHYRCFTITQIHTHGSR